jgi:glycosyltransferase involved in cell wall biosynthesis
MTETVYNLSSSSSASSPEDQARKELAARVLVIFGTIPLLGHERGNIQVFNALKQRGVDALFVTNKGYGHEMIQPELDRLGHRWTVASFPPRFSRGMSVGAWKQRLQSTFEGMVEVWRAGRDFRPTHVHVGHMAYFLTMLPAIKLLGVPVVYRIGDAPAQHRPLFEFLWRRVIIPNVDQFVCVSEYIRGLLIDAGAAPEQVRVIYSAPSKRPENREPIAVPPFDGRTFVYMGQLTHDKGVDLLVENALDLCRARPDVRFLLAGDYTYQNPFAEALIERVESEGLADRIQFLGYVEDVPGLLAAADVHICPSVWEEPLSNTVVEAKRSGVPSIVLPSGGLPELIEDGVDGWICDGKSAERLKRALVRSMLLSEADLTTMGEAALASMEKLGINEQAYADAWVSVYQQTMARKER